MKEALKYLKRIADIGFSIELVPEDNRYSYIVNNFLLKI